MCVISPPCIYRPSGGAFIVTHYKLQMFIEQHKGREGGRYTAYQFIPAKQFLDTLVLGLFSRSIHGHCVQHCTVCIFFFVDIWRRCVIDEFWLGPGALKYSLHMGDACNMIVS